MTALEKISEEEVYEKLNDRSESELEDANEQLQDSQPSTVSCISKMDYTLPKYRDNISPAIDKLVQMMSMPSLITSEDSSSDSPINSISSYNCADNKNFAVPITAKEHLDICFSSPKPFVSTYKGDSAENCAQSKEIDPLFSQIAQESMSSRRQEIADSYPDPNSEVKELSQCIYIMIV
ncbi:uncharacterized protein LOC114254308 [Monomorium pharaonis]|uniref:uncharacterized protein LOC114254308 n=1 Tax=Monomorium pharaonis TaxID=307658 RepID=UPI00174730EF|nr:uncharacterized protein LOC114254308 [Monomorium pharaonis]